MPISIYREIKFEVILRLNDAEVYASEIDRIKGDLLRTAKRACIFTGESAEILQLSNLLIDGD